MLAHRPPSASSSSGVASTESGAHAAVSATGLAAGYGAHTIWSGASFTIPAGAFAVVLGPNGAGKSTLVRLLLGLLRPAAGSLEVLGHRPRRGSPLIGYVPQGIAFDPDFSVRGVDFVGLGIDGHRWGLPLLSWTREDRRTAVAEAIQAVGAEAYAHRPIGRLSGGEQQRLLLAQALVGRPRILLLDEPLSNLDVRNQGAIVGLIGEVARASGLTVVMVAHDVNPLLPMLDLVIYVAQGRVACGAPAAIITSESLSRIYAAPIEVISDRRGRVFVVGLDEEVAHPHAG
jgi:zinc/manganese transport system ATP-binding protein